MIERVTLTISDLGYEGGGALTVERAIARLKGVVRAYVNPATETAYIAYDPSLVCQSDLVKAVERAGFGAGSLQQR